MKQIWLIISLMVQGTFANNEADNFDFLRGEVKETSVNNKECSQLGELAGAMAMFKGVSRQIEKKEGKTEVVNSKTIGYMLHKESDKLGISAEESIEMAQNILDYDIVGDIQYETLSYGYYYKIKCELEKEAKTTRPLNKVYKDLHNCWIIEAKTGVLAQSCFREVLIALDEKGVSKTNIKLLEEGKDKLLEKKPQLAIDNYFNPIIEACKNKNIDSSICGDALFHKGSAYIELHQYDEAKKWIETAIEKLPKTATFITELGYVYQIKKLPIKALEFYKKAEDIAVKYPNYQDNQRGLSRAIRGEGFILTDMGRLDEAELCYKRALKLNPQDEKATYELDYIKQLREEMYGVE